MAPPILFYSGCVGLYFIFVFYILEFYTFFPPAEFFGECISEQDLDELNIEIIRNTLYKAYLESFYNYCQTLGGTTADVMCEILAVSVYTIIL